MSEYILHNDVLLTTDELRLDPCAPQPARPSEPVPPFDRERMIRTIHDARRGTDYLYFAELALPPLMTTEEANAWATLCPEIVEITKLGPGTRCDSRLSDLTNSLHVRDFPQLPVAEHVERNRDLLQAHQVATVTIMYNLLSAREFLAYLTGHLPFVAGWQIQWVARGLLPHLDDTRRDQLRAALREFLPTVARDRYHPLLTLAAGLSMSHEVLAFVKRWPDPPHHPASTPYSREILCALGNPELIAAHAKRVRHWVGDNVLGWLAVTGTHDLPRIGRVVKQRHSNQEFVERSIGYLGRVQSPAVTPIMLDLMYSRYGRAPVHAWLANHPHFAIPGALPLTVKRNRVGEAALAYLVGAVQSGHAERIESHIATLDSKLAVQVRRVLASHLPTHTPTLTVAPDWLRHAPPHAGAKLPEWLFTPPLPSITVGGCALTVDHMRTVLAALSHNTFPAQRAFIRQFKRHADADSLDEFAVQLHARYEAAASPIEARWAFESLGLLGGEGVVRLLAHRLRKGSKHGSYYDGNAVLTVDCLAAIGSPSAVQALVEAAEEPHGTLLGFVRAALDRLALRRGLTLDQLADRAAPAFDLTPHGTRSLSYGSRTVTVEISPNREPVLRLPSGKSTSVLPRVTKADDPKAVRLAQAEWHTLRAEWCDTLALQTRRLERAMLLERAWSVAEFGACFRNQPLMGRLAQSLVWQGLLGAEPVRCVRYERDGTFSDSAERTVTLDGLTRLRIVHPVRLSPSEREAWLNVFADHELIQPFAQLTRPCYAHLSGNGKCTQTIVCEGKRLTREQLEATLVPRGWSWFVDPGSGCRYWTRVMGHSELLACVQVQSGAQDFVLLGVAGFVRLNEAGRITDDVGFVPWSKVPRVLIEELLYDLHTLAEVSEE